jgi:CDP-diacylglycerol pyrophosphatase
VAIFLALPGLGAMTQRDVLWRVVQACVAAHDLTGLSFPCLKVDVADGVDRGYAVLRSPVDKSHVIVSPTAHTIGIEDDRLRRPGAPNYFADAWASRIYATDGLPRPPGRGDLAMAVNSLKGRSQDQLHIHVDCIRPGVKQVLGDIAPSLDTRRWTRIAVLPKAPRYWALALASADLDGVNLFDLVASGLRIEPDAMKDTTIVVVGMEGAQTGFVVLARQRIPNSGDEAHGEALLDHSCPSFRKGA